MISSFPKIFAVGSTYIQDIFNEDVEISEKIDGSQMSFASINGHIYMRSKGAQLHSDNPEKMFAEGIDYIQQIRHLLPEGVVFYCEYLKKPKHNTLKYDRIPTNHLMLFGVMDTTQKFYLDLDQYAERLNIEPVPVIYRGKIENPTELFDMLERPSVLGGAKIEGVVVKNYYRKFLLGGQPMPLMAGKYVSEEFKEVHRNRWGKEETGKSKLETFFQSFRTEARWDKAIQHLAERGELENDPRDIGKLFKEVHSDIESEEKQEVMEYLWKEFSPELKRKAANGLPEYYKKRLLESSFEAIGKETTTEDTAVSDSGR